MERNEMLKAAGFSEKFLEALQEFEKVVPNVYYDVPFNDNHNVFHPNDSSSGDFIINRPNNNYNQNMIIRRND